METADFALLLSSVTAVAAVVAPVISTCITIKSNTRLKRIEFHSPKVYEAVNRMVSCYSKLPRSTDSYIMSNEEFDRHTDQSLEAYKDLLVACYDVMSLIPDYNFHKEILDFLDEVERNFYLMRPEHEVMFRRIISLVTLELSPDISKMQKAIGRYRNRRKRKKNRD